MGHHRLYWIGKGKALLLTYLFFIQQQGRIEVAEYGLDSMGRVEKAEYGQGPPHHFLPPFPLTSFLSCSRSRITKCLPISGSLSLRLPMYACLPLVLGAAFLYMVVCKGYTLHRVVRMEDKLTSLGEWIVLHWC